MKIGITGATGLIGQKLAPLARSQGHEIIGYSRRANASIPNTDRSLRLTDDRLQETPLDAIVHLAGESLLGLWTKAKRQRIWESRVDLTQNLVKSLAAWNPENRPKTVISASGVGYYGNRGDDLLTESEPCGEGFLADLCQAWEAAAFATSTSIGTRVVTLRTGVVLAREGGAFPLMKRAFSLGAGGRLGSGDQWMPWIHIDDEIRLILHALESPAIEGPLNLCAPEPVTNRELTKTLAKTLHRPAILTTPTFALKLALGDMADEVFLASQRAIPRKALDSGYTFQFDNLPDALGDLIT